MPLTVAQEDRVTLAASWSAPVQTEAGARDIPSVPVITLVLWAGCLAVGVAGFLLPYGRPMAPVLSEPPVQAEILQVELTNDPLPPLHSPPPSALPQPPVLSLPAALPDIPPTTAVAEPSAVAFALPVEGAVTLVEPARATFAAAPVVTPTAAAPPVQKLTYGQGEGRQPAPEYPFRARREGQEGVVGIRFSVGADGRVLAAEAFSPCPWKTLNDAALRVVRDRWRFSPGAPRLYEVSIRFQLTK